MGYVDLHVHSNYSDGTCTPKELVELAAAAGLSYIALTDHDTVSGIKECLEAAKGRPLQVIPGIEMSCRYEGQDVHLLGYEIEYDNPQLKKRLDAYQKRRDERNMRMIRKMQECGIQITPESFQEMFPEGILTRAHFATYLMRKGYVDSVKEGFERYVGFGKPCYIPKECITPAEAMDCIALGGGVAVLAHPMMYPFRGEQMESLLRQLTDLGLAGIETLYSENSVEEEEETRRLAQKYNLFLTGGSDFHGATKPYLHIGVGKGNLRIPECFVQSIRMAKAFLRSPSAGKAKKSQQP